MFKPSSFAISQTSVSIRMLNSFLLFRFLVWNTVVSMPVLSFALQLQLCIQRFKNHGRNFSEPSECVQKDHSLCLMRATCNTKLINLRLEYHRKRTSFKLIWRRLTMHKPSRFQEAIDAIINLKNAFEKIDQKPPPYLFGMYGELKVAVELEKRFPNARLEFKSGQSKSDISLIKNQKSSHIEVKTSRLKKEWYGEGYGFALHVKKCSEHPEAQFLHKKRGKLKGDLCYFNFLVCVCLSENLKAKYYIFSREELNQNLKDIKNKSSRFSHSPYRIIIPIKPRLEQLKTFDIKIYKFPEEYVDRWDRIA